MVKKKITKVLRKIESLTNFNDHTSKILNEKNKNKNKNYLE